MILNLTRWQAGLLYFFHNTDDENHYQFKQLVFIPISIFSEDSRLLAVKALVKANNFFSHDLVISLHHALIWFCVTV